MCVTKRLLEDDRPLPLLIEPAGPRPTPPGELCGWIEGNRGWLRDTLVEQGALLFRGFNVDDAGPLEEFTRAAGFPLTGYEGGVTPRRQIQGRIYSSTEARAGVPIPLHNEMSYSPEYPAAVAFCCRTAPRKRGETPIADMRRALARMPGEVVDRFERLGVRYVHHVPSEESRTRLKSWQARFDTADRSRVEAICAEQGIDLEWMPSGSVKLTQTRPAVLRHPISGVRVWFNQANVFHPSFSAELRHAGRYIQAGLMRGVEGLRRRFPGAMPPVPFDAAYGDGSPIPARVMRAVRAAMWGETVVFRWRRGDLLVLDNLRVAHGRMPFKGPRSILAALISRTAGPVEHEAAGTGSGFAAGTGSGFAAGTGSGFAAGTGSGFAPPK